jgi:hypothetical protein
MSMVASDEINLTVHRLHCHETRQRCCPSRWAFEDPFNSETLGRAPGLVLQGIFMSLPT